MKLFKHIATLLVCAFVSIVPAFAEDIDIFQGDSTVTGDPPNVLIFIDNSANWNSSKQDWEGGKKQGESELAALTRIVQNLKGRNVKVGLMFFVKGKGQDKDGGYVRFAIRDMKNDGYRGALTQLLQGYQAPSIFNDEQTGQQVATSNTQYGEGLYEVFKYFSGLTSYAGPADLRDYSGNGAPNIAPYTAGSLDRNAFANSGSRTYQSPLSADELCGKNYLIFIGNGFPVNSSEAPSSYGDANLAGFDESEIYPEGNKLTYADEWTRFLYQKGAKAPCKDGVCAEGRIVTYTIDVYKAKPDELQNNLLQSMAAVGGPPGNRYYAATSEAEIELALDAIFSEIQAVNSVFTSASLPVSVNSQGNYLNQIYMGVFRPDGNARPRWQGNLKQYQFRLRTVAGEELISLADAANIDAVNSGTGFITPGARSFWTTAIGPQCTGDATKGFWCFQPSGSGADKDSPDGDIVEKGGAAQKLRVLGPAARAMYTCTPDCTANQAPSLWKTDNTDLVTRLTSASIAISSISRSAGTVTVTTSADHGLASPSDTATISGSSQSFYNDQWSVVTDAAKPREFKFSVSETPVTPVVATGVTAASGTAVSQAVGALTFDSATGVVSATLAGHGYTTGQSVTISGAGVSASMASATTKCTGWPSTASCEYNGTFNIDVVNADSFTYSPPTSNFGSNTTTTTTYSPPETFVSPFGTVALGCKKGSGTTTYSLPITTMTRVSGTGTRQVTVTATAAATLADCNNPLAKGSGAGSVTGFSISGGSAANQIDGSYITPLVLTSQTNAAGAKTFRFNVTVTSSTVGTGTNTIIPASPATGTILSSGVPTRIVQKLERTAGNTATVTVTTPGTHGFPTGTSVTIAGAPGNSDGSPSEYNGTFSISNPTSNTFQYLITTGPPVASTGGSLTKGSGVVASTLIDWIRGVDNKEDENRNKAFTDVRASIHGDVLHSRPVVVSYGNEVIAGVTIEKIYGFYGANDGTLRAVKAGKLDTDGTEAWSFVAPEHYNTLGRLYSNKPLVNFPNVPATTLPTPTKRDYFFDGNIGAYQSADQSKTWIFASMRRGGRAIYAFDVSNPTLPKYLWKRSYTDTGFSELGYTWSEPKAIPIRKTAGVPCNPADANTFRLALVFGAGYDPVEEDKANQGGTGVTRSPTMGRGVFVLDAATGAKIALISPPVDSVSGVANSTKKYSFPSDVSVLDTDGDRCYDRLYTGDSGGNLFRIDIDNADETKWKIYKLAALGDLGFDGGLDDRKFLYAPDAVLGLDSGKQIIYVLAGTGNREEPRSNSIEDKFFMVKDTIEDVPLETPAAASARVKPLVIDPDLTKVTEFDASKTTIDASDASFKGWYLDYATGEKSVNAPLTIAGVTFFGTNRPLTVEELAARQICAPNLGVAQGYAVNFLDGTSAYGDRNGKDGITRADLAANFIGGGLPPSPVSGVVDIDGKAVRFVIGSGGSGVEGSPIEGAKVQAAPSSRRQRTSWQFRKDD